MRKTSSRFLAGMLPVLIGASVCGAQQPTYLPLEANSRWELHATALSQPMLFTVGRVNGPVFQVKWQNPWTNAEFAFEESGQQVLLRGVDLGNGMAAMPPGTVYFDFGKKAGSQWSNAVGHFVVVSTRLTVKTAAGTFASCIEISATDSHGGKTFWTFAPGIGFVQFGEGPSAFLLTKYGKGDVTQSAASDHAVSNDHVNDPDPASPGGHIYLGVESNPTPAQGYSFQAKEQSEQMSARAGSRLVFVGPKWSDFETSPGHYDFRDVDDRVRLAEETGSVVLLNLRLIDTNQRAVPAAYAGWSWDDQRMVGKVADGLAALAAHLKGRARWVTLGNEVDGYFGAHHGEIGAYGRMLSALRPSISRDFPGRPVAVNFTASAVHQLRDAFKSIYAETDIVSLNFYPINADFTFRDPAQSARELQDVITSTAGRPLIFQEIGYPSSTKLGSSEDKQAQFLEDVLQVLAANSGRVQAANFNWRGDLPGGKVNDLTRYYGLGNSANFREFLASLGWFHQDGTPKKVWFVFQQQAPALARKE